MVPSLASGGGSSCSRRRVDTLVGCVGFRLRWGIAVTGMIAGLRPVDFFVRCGRLGRGPIGGTVESTTSAQDFPSVLAFLAVCVGDGSDSGVASKPFVVSATAMG